LRTLFAFSILVQFTSFKLSTLGVSHPSCIRTDRLLYDETFVQLCILAVVNCADAAVSVFYSPVSTRCRIFLQLWTAVLGYRWCSLQRQIVA